MNQFTLLVIILLIFTYYGDSYVPKVLKENKELLLGVVGGLVLCSFLGMRLEGFRAWSPTQGAMRDYSADTNGSDQFHCEMDMIRGRPPAEVAARVQLCAGCKDAGCADRSKCSLDSDCESNYCQDNLCVPNTAIHKIASREANTALSSALGAAEMAVGLCNHEDFQGLACKMKEAGRDVGWAAAGCQGDPCEP